MPLNEMLVALGVPLGAFFMAIAIVALVGGVFALALPLLPLAALVFVIYLLVKASRRPVALAR